MTAADTFAAALARAQGHIRNPGASSTNPQYRSRYADLAAVIEAVMPALSAEGIGLAQDVTTEPRDGLLWVGVTTILRWGAEEHRHGPLWAPVVPIASKNGSEQPITHALGSTITYLRRYALSAVLVVSSDLDDDGNSAGPVPPMAPSKPQAPPKPAPRPDPQPSPAIKARAQLRQALIAWGASTRAEAEDALKGLGASSVRIDDLDAAECDRLSAALPAGGSRS